MKSKRFKQSVLPLVVLLLAAIVALIIGRSATPSSASLADGGFCVTAVYEDGGQTATAGAPGCTGSSADPEPQPEPETTENYSRMSVTVDNAPDALKGKTITLTVTSKATGEKLISKTGVVGTNGYTNFNLGIDTPGSAGQYPDLELRYQIDGAYDETITIASTDGNRNGETSREIGMVYVTRGGLVYDPDSSSFLKW